MQETTAGPTSLASGPSVVQHNDAPVCDAHSKNPHSINWSNVYSSDEESQQRRERNKPLHDDSSSESSSLVDEGIPLEPPSWRTQQEPHRRPVSHRAMLNRIDDDDISMSSGENTESDTEKEEERRSISPRNFHHNPHHPTLLSYVRTVAFCTPVQLLLVLFVVSCYTTFWLPYPEIRPKQVPKIPSASLPSVEHSLHKSNNRTKVASQSMLHARAAPEVELSYKPGLDRYYQQEGFSTQPWTKVINVLSLGTVLVWAVREQHRGNRC